MKTLFYIGMLAFLVSSFLSLSTFAQGMIAKDEDFPIGVFSDGGNYHLEDFRGKALVLFLYEQECPTCRGSIPERNKLVAKYKDKPVKFVAVGSGDTAAEVKSYLADTKLAMPTLADVFDIMDKDQRFSSQLISLDNIYQMRVIMPDGTIENPGYNGERLEPLLATIKWKYKDKGFNPKLNPAIELLEWNQYQAGLRLVNTFRKDSNVPVAASAQKLYDVVKTEAGDWKKEADDKMESSPTRSYDLYTRLKECFPDEPSFGADAALKKLKSNKTVVQELEARKEFAKVRQAMAIATTRQKGEVKAFCDSIARKYAGTPTGDHAASVARQLAK